MKDKVVTVFGGTGFLGKYVVRDLALAGYTVKVVSRHADIVKNLKLAGFVGQIVPVKGDITNFAELPKLVEGSYAVVNLVGILFEKGRRKFTLTHSEAPAELAKASKKAGVKQFVHVSSLVDAESKSKYAQSKIAGEKAVTEAFPEAVIFKPSTIFGAEDNFFNQFARMTSISPFLPLIGCGKSNFQPVFVGDIAKVIEHAVEGKVKAGTYQLGGPEILSFKEIMQRILKYTNKKRILLPIPFCLAKIIAIFAPRSVLTCDQVTLLQSDTVVTSRTKTFTELGIYPTAVEAIVPQYLAAYNKMYRF
jgi:NADH dehydrogenase